MQNDTPSGINPRIVKDAWFILPIITGSMIYVPYFLLTDKNYLVVNSSEFGKDVFLLIGSLVCLLAAGIVWYKIIRQFKKDRTFFGFDKDTNGYFILVSTIVGAAIIFLGWIYL